MEEAQELRGPKKWASTLRKLKNHTGKPQPAKPEAGDKLLQNLEISRF